MRPTDALALELLQRRGKAQEITAATWPKSPPESRQLTLFRLLRDLALSTPGQRRIGVAVVGGPTGGVVVARARAAGMVWDVEHLITDSEPTGVELLCWACERALASRARRLFLHTCDQGMGVGIARRAGFERYTEGATYLLHAGFSREPADSLPARPRFRSDEAGLFQLYTAAVPANVRAAEAMSHEEWAALYPGRKLWAPSVLGDREDYVWEMGPRVVGWMRVIFGQRSQFLDWLVHPLYEPYVDKMLRYALVQMSVKAPVVVGVREYQGAVRAAVERASFERGQSYVAWVRQLASRVREPAIAAVHAPARPAL